jgi:hypothetical protein
MEKNQNEKKSFVLRLSPKIHSELARWADEEFRSLNGQIEYILTDALKKRTKKSLNEEEPKNSDSDKKSKQ